MKASFWLGALVLPAVAACSSSSANSQAQNCDPCVNEDAAAGDSAATAVVGHDANPEGVPYPTPAAGYGRAARHGNTPGSVIQNFKFLGYPNADESHGLQTIALADYYDPCNKHSKLLHLSVAAVWCVPCNQETATLVASKAQLAADKVVMLQALSDGPTMGTDATASDLKTWIQKYDPTFTEMLDPGLANLGTFFVAAQIPWNCDIDPRTMEILDDGTGWPGTVAAELDPGLATIETAPGYPIAVKCD